MNTSLTVLTVTPTTDDHVVELWLANRPTNTARAYRADADHFRSFIGNYGATLDKVTLPLVQGYATVLTDLTAATQARRLSAAKSLLSYAHRIGYAAFNVAAPVKLPKVHAALANRIVDQDDVARLLALETDPRNVAMLTVLYRCGLRISEVASLRWSDFVMRADGRAQLRIVGKGDKERYVAIGPKLASKVQALRDEHQDDASPIFASRSNRDQGGAMDPSAIHRIVKAAADRARLPATFSAHWLRHAHASHALDNGAPIHVVQATLGHASLATTTRYVHARPTESSEQYLGAK